MRRWRHKVTGALDTIGVALSLTAALCHWIWQAPALAVSMLAMAVVAMGARLWLTASWRAADRRLAAAEELVRWQYGEEQWQEALAMLRRTSRAAGALRRLLAPCKYRGESGERSVVLLETGAVFGGTDWWRWDRAWRLSGAALFQAPGASAMLLIQFRPRLPLDRWQEREIFAGRQLTMPIPVPPGEEKRAERIAQYLDRKR